MGEGRGGLEEVERKGNSGGGGRATLAQGYAAAGTLGLMTESGFSFRV
jgi:hypothetical protein